MTKKQKATEEVVTSYKGFHRDWSCRGFQYTLGETAVHDGDVAACHGGLHACEYPLHVLRYYSPNKARYAIVEQSGQLSRHVEDSKIASSKLKVVAEIDLVGLIKASIKYTMDRCTPADGSISDVDNTVVTAEGKNKSSSASGNSGAATASGNSGAATASGNSGAATASGDYGAATASGDYGAATASGYSGAATASGNSGAAMVSGRNGRAKASIGSAIFLVERDSDWKVIHVWAGIAGQADIKPDTFYKLVGGKPVEA